MKINKIIIHNIASIADAEIDFTQEPLKSASLFLINGETGAGKSTILDAVCLALYNKTPRMARVSSNDKYAVEKEGENGAAMTINDNRQLLRRNTGEGFAQLYFTGNDNNDYQAMWIVRKAYNSTKGNLQPIQRQLVNLHTNQTLLKQEEIAECIERVVGLNYEQFCRTTLLAQGEFTRFLQSKSAEKSEILEKLTGTEIYSLVGRKIAEKNKQAEADFQAIAAQQEAIRLLTDQEKEEVEAQMAVLAKEENELQSAYQVLQLKHTWLNSWARLKSDLKTAQERSETAGAQLETPAYKQRVKLLDDYQNSHEVRRTMTDLKDEVKNAEKLTKTLEDLNKRYSLEHVAVENNEKELRQQKEELQKWQLKRNAFPENLMENQQKLHAEERYLSEWINALEQWLEQKETLDKENGLLKDYQQQQELVQKEYGALLPRLEEAKQTLEKQKTLYDQMKLAVDDAVKAIRAQLHAGDSCPVCGAAITADLSDAAFEEKLLPFKTAYDKAQTDLNALNETHQQLFAQLKVKEQQVAAQQERCKQCQLKWEKLSAALEVVAAQTKMDFQKDNASLEKIRVQWENVKRELKLIDGQMLELKNVNDNIGKLSSVVETLQQKSVQLQKQLNELRISIATNQEHREESEKRQKEMQNTIDSFLVQHVDITLEALQTLVGCTPKQIDDVKNWCEARRNDSVRAKAMLEALLQQQDKLNAEKPSMNEEDTLETLAQQMENANRQIREKMQLRAEKNAVLQNDAQNRTRYLQIQQEMDKAKVLRDKWNELYKLLGDNQGDKFRNIAQSFILEHLLSLANGYLKYFSDRYRLICQPGSLVILVEDAHVPSQPQAANILSGGESFMVSLALALALAHLNNGSNSVDTLFIDEGFGTLSPDCLSSVIDTLETLHQLGGRRVGIISHVAELSERITTQISVKRIDPTCSAVSVKGL